MKKQITKKFFVFIITLLMSSGINQFANAQSCNNAHPCPSGYTCVNHVCVRPLWHCAPCGTPGYSYPHSTNFPQSQVSYYLSLGWKTSSSQLNCNLCHFRFSEEETINETSLTGIRPNPISQSATITFTLSQSQKVSLKVFDMNGRLVTTLADYNFEKGDHEITWNASDVNAGIYFLQFQSAENLQAEKLIVTK